MELEYLRQLYEEYAPRLDSNGFQLYWTAEELTGVDLYSFYPYEDNRGMFEEMDGASSCGICSPRISERWSGRSSPERPMRGPCCGRWTPRRRSTGRLRGSSIGPR